MKKKRLEFLVTSCAFILGIMFGIPLLSGKLLTSLVLLFLVVSALITFVTHGILELFYDIDDPIGTAGVIFLSVVFLLGALVISQFWNWAGLLIGLLVIVRFFFHLETI